ncbi:CocE/NonD family hydrolase [Sediminibacillus dalangtanensis]|uniref:CocE/NonD family hydrolase n=1 Tax=Sediminibacillus dalangtanensis TaxID=2729421 RepID=UPI001FD7AB29|nr:CocE/NonD family hydrolase [Sediminibacillus dalangtanensis]
MPKTAPVVFEKDVPCRLRDGVTLYANVYRPDREGSYPVLLTRHPYNKNLVDFSHRYVDPFRLAAAGYVVIIQDVRGRFSSEGQFVPFIHEGEDGYDAVEWAANLPYCDGKVGMFGLSYYGFTQLFAAAESPPSLKAIFPAQTGSSLNEDMLFRQGALEYGLFATWMLDSVAPDLIHRECPDDYPFVRKDIESALHHINDTFHHVPLTEWPPLRNLHPVLSLYQQFITQEISNEAQSKASIKHQLSSLELPAYHLAGWYDCFLGSTLENFQEMCKAGEEQRLIIGPWGHGDFSAAQGERFFGAHAAGDWMDEERDITALHIEWFDKKLKATTSASGRESAPVQLFVMGIDKWREEKEWPLARTRYIPYYLHSNGKAGLESGTLSTTKPQEEPTDQFCYDPSNPVPTVGGNGLFYKGENAGPCDQNEVEARKDVFVYTSEALKEPLEVTGPIEVVLWAATDAVSTDFTAKLVDVWPDGKAFNLADGIVRGDTCQESEIGAIRYQLDLWATSNVFLPGHSIRLEISSSNFPRYDVNPNTGKTTIDSEVMLPASQTIYHDENYPSYILLPVIPTKI